MLTALLLAGAGAEGGGAGNGGDTPGMPCTWQAMVPLALILGVFYFLIIMPQRKRERKRKEMLAEVKKHDRVMTIGGIVGVVYSVSDDEVVLKVDEKNDGRLRFARSAVNRIIGGEDDDTRTDAQLPHEDEK